MASTTPARDETMISYRPHRSTLTDSMSAVREFASLEELAEAMADELGRELAVDDLQLKFYGHDHRIGWDTYVLTLEGYGVLGFTDSPGHEVAPAASPGP